MRSLVLRVQLSDQPGELHELTAALSTVGINIIGVDVEQCDGTSVIDRLTLAVPDQVTEADVVATVQRAGKTLVSVRGADRADLRDPIVPALDWASALSALRSSTAQAEQALRSVADADEAWLLPAAPDLPGVVGRAARLRAPMIERATEVGLVAVDQPVGSLPHPRRPPRDAGWSPYWRNETNPSSPHRSHGRAR